MPFALLIQGKSMLAYFSGWSPNNMFTRDFANCAWVRYANRGIEHKHREESFSK